MFERKDFRSASLYRRPFFGGIGISFVDFAGGVYKIEPASVALETADAGVAFTVVVFGCGFGFVIFPLAAAVTGLFLALSELFFDADGTLRVGPFGAAFTLDVFDCFAELGLTLTWLFFLPQA